MNHIEQNELFTNLLRFLDSLTLRVNCVFLCSLHIVILRKRQVLLGGK